MGPLNKTCENVVESLMAFGGAEVTAKQMVTSHCYYSNVKG
jgi:hypothetical protein